MKRSIFKKIDWRIVIYIVLLTSIGLVALYSASVNSDLDAFKRQLVWIIASIPMAVVIIMIDYSTIARLSPYIYGGILLLLVAVLFTPPVNGATSWFQIGSYTFQPGEFAKIAVIIFTSYIAVHFQKKAKEDINKITRLALILLITAVPMILIILQPDYGTAVTYIISLALILFVGGIKKRYILISLLLVVTLLPLLYFFILPDHAKARIDVYLNPDTDPRGAGYNIIQSKLAIGAGRLLGMGWLQGTQTHLGFLYPKTTDFIFPVIGEELGFLVCRSNYSNLCTINNKMYKYSKKCKRRYGFIYGNGASSEYSFIIQLKTSGMTIGLLPITGVPLPFISYGGTAIMSNFICIALILNISVRKQKSMFSDE